MYALGLASVVAGDGITCPGQANFEHDTAATAYLGKSNPRTASTNHIPN